MPSMQERAMRVRASSSIASVPWHSRQTAKLVVYLERDRGLLRIQPPLPALSSTGGTLSKIFVRDIW
jgi:hypothetical protein